MVTDEVLGVSGFPPDDAHRLGQSETGLLGRGEGGDNGGV